MSARRPVRVLVADDSEVCRELLREAIEADGDAVVVGEAVDGHEAIRRVRELSPDLVTMDVRMPRMDGLETIGYLMSERPLPILVVTGLPAGPTDTLVFEATRRGALDVVTKPAMDDADAARELRRKIRWLASVPVVRHVAPRESQRPSIIAPLARIRLVGLAASAGGPAALGSVLAALPASLPLTLAVVQHFPEGFASTFARYLGSRTKLRVVLAERPVTLSPGLVVVPAEGAHLVARSPNELASEHGPPVGSFRPSADVLFASMAEAFPTSSAGFVLTGIGKDGTEGLLALRRAGGLTFAQDQESSVVWGMPRSATESGAAACEVSLTAVAPTIESLGGKGR